MNPIHLELSFSSVYGHAPEAVWAALTDPEALRSWFLETNFQAQVGKPFYVKGPHIGVVQCTVVALDPPHRMEWSWKSAELATPTTVIFTLEAVEEGTRLSINHIGSASRSHERDITRGWPSRLACLRRWLDGSLSVQTAISEGVEVPGFPSPAPPRLIASTAEVSPMTAITVQSTHREEIIDLTEEVTSRVKSLTQGLCSLFTRHTTCALTVLTDEEGIGEDLLTVLRGLVLQNNTYVHDSANHVRAHVLSALIGPSLSIPVHDGRLRLGQFQRVVLLEFEGPRERLIEIMSYAPPA